MPSETSEVLTSQKPQAAERRLVQANRKKTLPPGRPVMGDRYEKQKGMTKR